MFDFAGSIVAVTGASRGIGLEIARQFWLAGASLAICSRNEQSIQAAAAEIDPAYLGNHRILATQADSASVADMKAFISQTIAHFSRIDILVNNAGIQIPKPSLAVTETDWDATVDTNLKGCFFTAQAAALNMADRAAGGSIINIGSVQGMTVVIGQAVYAATKAGISQLTRSLAREWGKQGIRVNCVAPGSIPTAINAAIYANPANLAALQEKLPLSRQGRAGEIADAVLFLASEKASYITGQTLYVDGGLTVCHG